MRAVQNWNDPLQETAKVLQQNRANFGNIVG